MAPTTGGIAAAAKAMQDEGLCGEVAVYGLGLPDEMRDFVNETQRLHEPCGTALHGHGRNFRAARCCPLAIKYEERIGDYVTQYDTRGFRSSASRLV